MASQGVDPELADYIAQAAHLLGKASPGVTVRVVSGYRSPQQQMDLVRRWNAGDRAGLAAEPAVSSMHTLGRAVDLQLAYKGRAVPVRDTPTEYWRFLADLLEPVGVRWGGRFRRPDPNHFDL